MGGYEGTPGADYAIDEEALAVGQGYGEWTPAYHWLAPYIPIYDADFRGRTYDRIKPNSYWKKQVMETVSKTTLYPMPEPKETAQ
jgi:hypothetical protein